MKNNVSNKDMAENNQPQYTKEELIAAIPYGEEQAKSAVQIMSTLGLACFWQFEKSNDLVKKAKKTATEKELPLKIKEQAALYKKSVSAKKKIQRNIASLIATFGTIDKLKRGQTQYYFWQSSEFKYAALGRDEVSAERHLARAIAFQFVDEYLEDFLPPAIVKNLSEDINDAYKDLIQKNSPHAKLQFYPSGFEIGPSPLISEDNKEDWNTVYDALNKEYVVQAEYKSLHQAMIPSVVQLSLQRIQYANHKILVLCYVHEQDIVKTFEVSRLRNVTRSTQYAFKAVNFEQYEKPYEFVARVNVGVKDYFKSVRFGDKFEEPEHEADDSWIIKSIIKVPEHFSESKKGQPDPFAIANFLSTFADSMEVIKPDFLRAEMKRRSDNMAKLYSDEFDSIQVISKSPHEQTGNAKKLQQIEQRQ